MNLGTAARTDRPAHGPAPVDWGLAAAAAERLVPGGPIIPRDEADHVVRQLRELTVIAEEHVRALTGLGADLPMRQGEVVDRRGWVRAASAGLAALTEDALPPGYPGPFGSVLAGTAGVQAGMVLAFLSSRVLGQYDPFGTSEGRLLLVAPNVVAAQRSMDVPDEDFRMWVCLHECTHRLQFTAVPWLREHFATEVARLMSTLDASAVGALTRLPEAVRGIRERVRGAEGLSALGPIALSELLQSPEQRAALDRIVALSTLLEGHADHVMDAVGPSVVPSVAVIRARFTARRRGGGMLDRLLRALLGVEAKVRQYAEGSAFTRQVIDAVGMAGFNTVWTSPDTLPTRAEITDPGAWLRRVHG
ncbi:zinc-dependent metalloprotease [Gandjariella thermophila]|uniref:Coenzyme F420 biosynthesis-associated protein n=1 Tax=Gandjariella thermophila TaxID=1931992 RepID=A0A4D4J8D1_9PSEU|nr:zinc-dependent metalloprotease [Gandjariella thermophila]GDY30766.1 hypothetical protein GTS_23990 [Gandjariella thermophila]